VLNGEAGNDTITVGNGSLDNLYRPVAVNGGPGADDVIVNDSAAAHGSTYTLTGSSVSRPVPLTTFNMDYAAVESLTLNAQPVGNTFNLTASAPPMPLTVNAGGGIDVMNINVATVGAVVFNGGLNAAETDTLNVNAGTFTLNADARVGSASLQVNVSNSGSNVVFNATQHLRGLTLNAGTIATMPSNGNRYFFTRNLSINASAKLNLADNDFIWDYIGGPAYSITRQYVLNGLNNPDGVGGIVSSPGDGDVVLAVGEQYKWGENVFNGESIDGTTIVGKYTYYGDANLDGQVTTDDYVAVDLGLGTGNSWVEGDFDLNGAVTTDDYVVVDLNLGKGTTSPLATQEESAETNVGVIEVQTVKKPKPGKSENVRRR
jgi:hypothetical protein